jgi:hypothetical protein
MFSSEGSFHATPYVTWDLGFYSIPELPMNINPVGNTNRIKSTMTPGYNRVGIRYLGGVNIPCRLVTLVTGPIIKSGKRNNPQSKPVCQ